MAMSPASPPDCPRCGARLARDNDDGRCAPCQAAERDRLHWPPSLPATFWDHPPIRQASTERHLGRVIRAYRCHPYHGRHPLPQETVARWLGITQAQLSRIENGRPIVHLDRLTHWAKTLHIPTRLLWFKFPDDQGCGAPSVSAQRARSSSRTPHVDNREHDLHFMRSLRSADRRIGGSHLYPAVTAYLDDGTLTSEQAGGSTPTNALAAAASLNEMAGWMAHDVGASDSARRHLNDALLLAQCSGDQQLETQVHASLSHLACYNGNASEAISQALQGLAVLQGAPTHNRLQARLLILQARGHALAGRTPESGALIAQAEATLLRGGDSGSDWLSPFDTTAFAIEAARCFLRLGDLSEALGRLGAVVATKPNDRVRSRAFAQLMQVTALLGRGDTDEACSVAHQAIDQTAGLGSALIVDQLRSVAVLLKPRASACADIPPLLDRLRQTFRERAWIGTLSRVQRGMVSSADIG